MIEAKIYIILKKTIVDPQGLAIKHALSSLGHRDVEDVRMGKLISIKLDAEDKNKAGLKIEQMCKRLLANPVIEDYKFEINEA